MITFQTTTKIRICTSETQGKYLECATKHFITGIRKVRSVLLGYHAEHASYINRISMTLLASILLLHRNKKSFTVGYLPRSKKMTLLDRAIFSDLNILTTLWLQTSVQGLIGNEKDFKPFWNPRCQEISKSLWLPTEIGSVALPLSFSNSSSPKPTPNSSFWIQKLENPQTKSYPKISSPSFTFTPVEAWEKDAIRAKRIRLYPNAKQRKILKEWIGTTRWVYNQAVNHVRSLERTNVDVYELTKMFVTHKSRDGTVNDTIPDWTLDTPKDIRKGALWDLKAAYKAAFTNLKQGNVQHFNVGFRRKKSFPSIDIPSTALKYTDNRNLQLFPRYNLGELSIARRQRKKDLVALESDCRLSYKNDCWYLYVPYTPKPKIVVPTHSVCALDPGGRTFQTLYSPDHTIKFQHNRELHKRLRERLDFFQSLRAKKWVRSNNYRRRRNRIYRQIGWAIDALHYSTIENLKSYQQILLPVFESQEMVKGGRLRSDSTRELMSLQHYKFKQRLQNCLKLQPHSNVEIVTEEFTSQTCGHCGSSNTPTGAWYRCSSCTLEIDRDFNGARNILLKHLVSI